MALTGDPEGPPLAPDTTAAVLLDEALVPFGLDASVLGERAAHLGLTRAGRTSCGGATRLLEGADGWAALALPRSDDLASIPALLGVEPGPDPWSSVTTAVRERPVAEVVEMGILLGMAVSDVVGSPAPIAVTGAPRPDAATRPAPQVVDLSALWAGPLCTHLLGRSGASVVKVESTTRPDGARVGVRSFFDLLNHGKASVGLDLTQPGDQRVLADLIGCADIVVSSSRRRAIEQLGLDPAAFLAGGSDRVWVAVTGHGWGSDRVGFGDDAAAAGGLVAWDGWGQPRFAGDAVADPLCGALAARRALDAWGTGGRWFIDAPLAGAAAAAVPVGGTGEAVAAHTGVGGAWLLDGVEIDLPRVRVAEGPAAELRLDTQSVQR